MLLHVAKTNGYPLILLTKLHTGMFQTATSPIIPNIHRTKRNICVTFIFHVTLIRNLSHIFRNTVLKITFRSTNTNRNTLRTRTNNIFKKPNWHVPYEMGNMSNFTYSTEGPLIRTQYRQHSLYQV